MKTIKRVLSIVLALITVFGVFCTAFAQDEQSGDQTEPAAEIDYLDSSAVDGKLYAYKGIEANLYIYPFPEEAESKFDIYKAQITCSDDSVLDYKPDKGEQARFGNVSITGKKLGSATITVTEPESGKSCSAQVTVLPAIGYHIRSFFINLEYVPFMIFMQIAAILNKFGLIQ